MNDNGLIPSQGQQDEQLEGVHISGKAIDDDDVVDIMTLYPPWSADTNDRCDITQIANDKSIKEIQDEKKKIHQLKLKLISPV